MLKRQRAGSPDRRDYPRDRGGPDLGIQGSGGRSVESQGGAILLPVFIIAAVLLGGASAAHSLPALALQVFAVVLLVVGLWRTNETAPSLLPSAWWTGLGLLAVGVLHIVPLPAAVWTLLPGRGSFQESLALVGLKDPLLAISLKPNASVAAVATLLTAVVVVVLFLRSPKNETGKTAMTIIVLTVVSLALGILQFVGGRDSLLYFHSYTNWGMAVGFFANANHLATLLLISVPMVAAVLSTGVGAGRIKTPHALGGMAVYSGAVALGVTLTTSVAGIALLPVSILFSLFLIPSTSKFRTAGFGLSLLAVASAVGLSAGVLGTSLGDNTGRDEIWRSTLAGIREFWPIGSGIGTFPSVYPLFEKQSGISARFVNHAHSDYLEWLFEGGLIAATLIIVGLVWWIKRSLQVWRVGAAPEVLWQRSASIVVGLVMAHSLVDYPLRTPAILAIFTLFVAVLASVPSMPKTAKAAGDENGLSA